MAWATVTTPVTGTPISSTTFGIPVAGNFAVIGGAWTTYTPTWTASTVNPSVNNGTITGRYMQAGKLVMFSILLQMGSTTSFGSGQYSFSLPVAAQTNVGTLNCGVWLNDNSGSANNSGTVNLNASPSIIRVIGPTAAVSQTSPWTWAQSDIIAINGTYEAA